MSEDHRHVVFAGHDLVGEGQRAAAFALVRRLQAEGRHGLLIFREPDGRQVDLPVPGAADPDPPQRRAVGRPRLGVQPREITLLPRHWDWLAQQPQGASATLRRLVEVAMRDPAQVQRSGREAAYRFLTALAGDMAGYEEACRALFTGDSGGFERATQAWPQAVVQFARQLAGAGLD